MHRALRSSPPPLAPLRAVASAALAVWATAAVATATVPAAPEPPTPPRRRAPLGPRAPDRSALTALPCVTAAACPGLRHLDLDRAALGIDGLPGLELLVYDPEPLIRPLSSPELDHEPELSLAVRLIISEVGADRLLYSRYGLLEAIGILYTVHNRLDRGVYDPLQQPLAPAFPGCGPGGSFASCANAEQYLGMATWRALDPGRHYRPEVLLHAVDVAVMAWTLVDRGLVADFTEGATNYVHRCGAAGYGRTTHHCDAHLGRPARDIAGANPYTGPTVFRAPERWRHSRGWYTLYESRWVDYDPWWHPEEVDAWNRWEMAQDALAEAGLAAWDAVADAGEDGDFAADGVAEVAPEVAPAARPILRAWVHADRVEPDADHLVELVNAMGPAGTPATHAAIWEIHHGKR